MKKGELYKGIVERVDFPNKGIVRVEGEEAFAVVKNVIPGQEISFCVSKKRNGHVEANLSEVIKKSPLEKESSCPHFGVCGGCVYMNLPYEEQLKLKEGQVKSLLEGALKEQEEEWEFQGIKPSPKPTEYRNKMEFSFGDAYKGGPLALGMHKRGSFYDIESVYDCQIVDEDYRNILNITCNYFQNVPFYHKLKHEGYLRHLLVRKAVKTGEILVALVTSSQVPPMVNDEFIFGWKDSLLKINLLKGSSFKGILHIINDSLADVVQADETRVLYGEEVISEELLNLKFNISTFSFFQTNSLGAEVLYETARDYIGDLRVDGKPAATVFDLYSGTGTIAQLMAPASRMVYGVEIIEEAVEAAKENAKINGLDNCRFIAGDVLKVLDEIEEKPDFIILDPPRDGVHPKALRKIIDYGVDRMIYISCKPTSLVRDLEMLLGCGYHVEKACAVDMFPGTANIETIAMLQKINQNSKAKSYVNVGIDAEEYYRIKNS